MGSVDECLFFGDVNAGTAGQGRGQLVHEQSNTFLTPVLSVHDKLCKALDLPCQAALEPLFPAEFHQIDNRCGHGSASDAFGGIQAATKVGIVQASRGESACALPALNRAVPGVHGLYHRALAGESDLPGGRLGGGQDAVSASRKLVQQSDAEGLLAIDLPSRQQDSERMVPPAAFVMRVSRDYQYPWPTMGAAVAGRTNKVDVRLSESKASVDAAPVAGPCQRATTAQRHTLARCYHGLAHVVEHARDAG